MGCGMDDSGGEECTHVIIQSSCLNSSKALNLACSVIVLSGDSKVNLLTATILSGWCFIFWCGGKHFSQKLECTFQSSSVDRCKAALSEFLKQSQIIKLH